MLLFFTDFLVKFDFSKKKKQQFASEQDGTEADNDDQDLTLATMEFLADYVHIFW